MLTEQRDTYVIPRTKLHVINRAYRYKLRDYFVKHLLAHTPDDQHTQAMLASQFPSLPPPPLYGSNYEDLRGWIVRRIGKMRADTWIADILRDTQRLRVSGELFKTRVGELMLGNDKAPLPPPANREEEIERQLAKLQATMAKQLKPEQYDRIESVLEARREGRRTRGVAIEVGVNSDALVRAIEQHIRLTLELENL